MLTILLGWSEEYIAIMKEGSIGLSESSISKIEKGSDTTDILLIWKYQNRSWTTSLTDHEGTLNRLYTHSIQSRMSVMMNDLFDSSLMEQFREVMPSSRQPRQHLFHILVSITDNNETILYHLRKEWFGKINGIPLYR